MTFSLPADHPCLPGHFPGHPVVPGVLLLDAALEAARAEGPGRPATIVSAKFLRPVGPEQPVAITLRRTPTGRLAFTGTLVDGTPAFTGEIEMGATAVEAGPGTGETGAEPR